MDKLSEWKEAKGYKYVEKTCTLKNHEIFYRYYSQDTCKGVVFLFHNIGETSKELVTLANLLAQNEYDVIACDMINHGRSSTDKKFLLKEYPAIAWDFIQYTKTLELGSSKYTLLGVGFGALIVDNLYAKNQYFYYTEKKILFVVLNKL